LPVCKKIEVFSNRPVRLTQEKIIILINHVTWEQAYIQAALEVDKVKMVDRLSAARQAILRQLEVFQHSAENLPEYRTEIKKMEIALKNLDALERESQNW
jgi:hypothetical protein